ncbi:MAG: hypothetical protein ACN4GT_10565 [Gammaproteobacteria bacterium]
MTNLAMPRRRASAPESPTARPCARHEAAHVFSVAGAVDQVFGLFDAVSERDWVDDWDPEAIYPRELSRAEGSVFTTERDGRLSVWTVLRYAPEQHVAEYLVTEYGYQHRWIYVSCSAAAQAATDVCVRYVTTALTQAGQDDIERYGKDYLRSWQEPVQAAIDRMAAAPSVSD